MGLRGRLRRLEREASEDGVLIRQRDGSVRRFPKMDVMADLYLARLAAALGLPSDPGRQSDVMAALDNATPESREEILRAHTSAFMGDLEPAEPGPPREIPDLSEP
jgi:hypothetical protein